MINEIRPLNKISHEPELTSSNTPSIFNRTTMIAMTITLAVMGSFAVYMRESILQVKMDRAFNRLDCDSLEKAYNSTLLPSWNTEFLECRHLQAEAKNISLTQFCEMDSESRTNKIEQFSLTKNVFSVCEMYEQLKKTNQILSKEKKLPYFESQSLSLYDLKQCRWSSLCFNVLPKKV